MHFPKYSYYEHMFTGKNFIMNKNDDGLHSAEQYYKKLNNSCANNFLFLHAKRCRQAVFIIKISIFEI